MQVHGLVGQTEEVYSQKRVWKPSYHPQYDQQAHKLAFFSEWPCFLCYINIPNLNPIIYFLADICNKFCFHLKP